MNGMALLDRPHLREQDWGVGQTGRAQLAERMATQTRPLLQAIIDSRLIQTIGVIPGEAGRPLFALAAAADDVACALQSAVTHSVAVTVVKDKKVPAANYRDLTERKQVSLRPQLPSFDYPVLPEELRRRWRQSSACAQVCLTDSLFLSYRSAVVEALGGYARELIKCGLLGFMMDSDTEPGYTYTVHTVEVDPDGFETLQSVSFNEEAPAGNRRTYTTRSKGKGSSRHVTVEHVHFLGSDHRTVPFRPGGEPLPQRVRALQETLPKWLVPHLTLTTGSIVREEVHERDEYATEWESEVITQQSKASPALSLGVIVLAGWSNSDLESDLQTARAVSSSLHPGWLVLGGVAAAVVLFFAPSLIPSAARFAARVAASA